MSIRPQLISTQFRFILLLTILTSAAGTARSQVLVMQDLGTLGGEQAMARAINNNSQVVGWAETADGERHAFLWDADSGMQDLGTLGGDNSEAWDINDKGEVVGRAQLTSGRYQAFIWDSRRGMRSLGGRRSYATGINNFGEVIGTLQPLTRNSTDRRAFVWNASDGRQRLEQRARNSYGWAINDMGQSIGAIKERAISQPFIHDVSKGIQDLEPGLSTRFPPQWFVRDINRSGQVAGFTQAVPNRQYDDDYQAFVWDQENGVQFLDLGPDPSHQAHGIDDIGRIVGRSRREAFVWSPWGGKQVFVPLSSQEDPRSRAYDINMLGQVVGECSGAQPNSTARTKRAFLVETVAPLFDSYGPWRNAILYWTPFPISNAFEIASPFTVDATAISYAADLPISQSSAGNSRVSLVISIFDSRSDGRPGLTPLSTGFADYTTLPAPQANLPSTRVRFGTPTVLEPGERYWLTIRIIPLSAADQATFNWFYSNDEQATGPWLYRPLDGSDWVDYSVFPAFASPPAMKIYGTPAQ